MKTLNLFAITVLVAGGLAGSVAEASEIGRTNCQVGKIGSYQSKTPVLQTVIICSDGEYFLHDLTQTQMNLVMAAKGSNLPVTFNGTVTHQGLRAISVNQFDIQ